MEPATAVTSNDAPATDRRLAVTRLEARSVTLSFGGHRVLDNLDLNVCAGELVLLRGENGSGKTSLLNALSGVVLIDRGSIRLNLLSGWVNAQQSPPDSLARLGLGRLWQDIRLFPTMSVLDNVLAATPSLLGQSPWLTLVTYPRVLARERAARERALANLDSVGMKPRAGSSADMISVGQMKRVALARLLQMNARVWLLDEPLAGLDTHSAAQLVRDIDRLRREHDVAIVVVEHKHDRIEGIADRCLTLNRGQLQTTAARHHV